MQKQILDALMSNPQLQSVVTNLLGNIAGGNTASGNNTASLLERIHSKITLDLNDVKMSMINGVTGALEQNRSEIQQLNAMVSELISLMGQMDEEINDMKNSISELKAAKRGRKPKKVVVDA